MRASSLSESTCGQGSSGSSVGTTGVVPWTSSQSRASCGEVPAGPLRPMALDPSACGPAPGARRSLRRRVARPRRCRRRVATSRSRPRANGEYSPVVAGTQARDHSGPARAPGVPGCTPRRGRLVLFGRRARPPPPHRGSAARRSSRPARDPVGGRGTGTGTGRGSVPRVAGDLPEGVVRRRAIGQRARSEGVSSAPRARHLGLPGRLTFWCLDQFRIVRSLTAAPVEHEAPRSASSEGSGQLSEKPLRIAGIFVDRATDRASHTAEATWLSPALPLP